MQDRNLALRIILFVPNRRAVATLAIGLQKRNGCGFWNIIFGEDGVAVRGQYLEREPVEATPTTFCSIMDDNTLNAIPTTNLEYLVDQNDESKRIRIIRKQDIQTVVAEYKRLMEIR